MPKTVVAVSFVGVLPPMPERPGAPKGYPRQSSWQNLEDASDYLVLLGFASEADAQDDLRRLVDSRETISTDFPLPSAVSHVAIEHEHRTVLDDVPMNGYVAVAKTVANPGYGPEAGENLEETVSTFVQFQGYCGHLEGSNVAIPEEVWAFLFASSLSEIPRPINPEIAIQTYRRIA